MTNRALAGFLARHPSFGGWSDEWIGVPLEFRACLADELPAIDAVGSVRALVLRGDDILMVHSDTQILSVGGRRKPGETIEQTLVREVAEETGWIVEPIAVIGFIHGRHLDDQRPEWGRPAPDFIDPMFVVRAVTHDSMCLVPDEIPTEFVPIATIDNLGVDDINRTFLDAAVRARTADVNQRV